MESKSPVQFSSVQTICVWNKSRVRKTSLNKMENNYKETSSTVNEVTNPVAGLEEIQICAQDSEIPLFQRSTYIYSKVARRQQAGEKIS